MHGEIRNIKFSGVACLAPQKVVCNSDFVGDVEDKKRRKQIKATGIERKHHVVDGQTAVDLAIGAGKRLLDELQWNLDEIKVVLYVSSYTLFSIPSTAFYIQKSLNIGNDCFVYDMNLACSGFVSGITTIASLLQNCEEGSKGLLFVGVNPSSTEEESAEEISLFGDAGGVAAFEVKDGYKIIFDQHSDGNRYASLIKKEKDMPLSMDGMGVFNFTISDVADSINEFFQDNNIEKNDIDFFLLHQAQKFILQKVMDFCDLPEEKCPVSYQEFGNTGAVSIPLTMAFNSEEFSDDKKYKLFMSGFGAGLSWGNIYIETDNLRVLSIVYSDEKYPQE